MQRTPSGNYGWDEAPEKGRHQDGARVKRFTGRTGSVLFLDNEIPADSTLTSELLTIPEVASMFKVSETTVRRLQTQRCIRFIKVGGSVRFAKDDVMAYLEQRKVEVIGK